jgi:hypothetical protein
MPQTKNSGVNGNSTSGPHWNGIYLKSPRDMPIETSFVGFRRAKPRPPRTQKEDSTFAPRWNATCLV